MVMAPHPITVIKRLAVLLPLLALPLAPAMGQQGANLLMFLALPQQ